MSPGIDLFTMPRCQIDNIPFNCNDRFNPIFNNLGKKKNPEGVQVELGPIISEIHQCDVAKLIFFHVIAIMDSIRYLTKLEGKILNEFR